MFYELITCNHHNNNIALYKCWKTKSIFYKKVAFSRKANDVISKEKKGYDWFFGNLKRENQTELRIKYYNEIDIPEFKGKKFSYKATISGNESIIETIIDFYRSIWLFTDKFSVHGDMALSNFIIGSNYEINIMDWEHFHFTEPQYFGFDIINMLFIAICNQYKRTDLINRKNRDFLRQCYNRICNDLPSSNVILEKPFQNSRDYMREFYYKFDLNIPIGKKFTLACCPRNELEKLDLIMT